MSIQAFLITGNSLDELLGKLKAGNDMTFSAYNDLANAANAAMTVDAGKVVNAQAINPQHAPIAAVSPDALASINPTIQKNSVPVMTSKTVDAKTQKTAPVVETVVASAKVDTGKCSACGGALFVGRAHCPDCGAKVSTVPTQPTQPTQPGNGWASASNGVQFTDHMQCIREHDAIVYDDRNVNLALSEWSKLFERVSAQPTNDYGDKVLCLTASPAAKGNRDKTYATMAVLADGRTVECSVRIRLSGKGK